ncbi:MAG: hypothetical protein AAGB34_05215 [Planctomycetota bacterium]
MIGLAGCGAIAGLGAGAALTVVQAIPGLAAVAGDTYDRTGSHMVEAEYTGLQGRDYAVLVSTDRIIEANHPRIVRVMTNALTRRLSEEEVGATAMVPGPRVLEYQYSTPNWPAMSFSDLAEEFTVDRLILVEILEYRHNEPGNQHLWDGRFSARVGVVEADGSIPDDFAFLREIRVSYPDTTHTRRELSEEHIEAVLQTRMADRISWLFYDHEELNSMPY